MRQLCYQLLSFQLLLKQLRTHLILVLRSQQPLLAALPLPLRNQLRRLRHQLSLQRTQLQLPQLLLQLLVLPLAGCS